jgi:hypothetical protein
MIAVRWVVATRARRSALTLATLAALAAPFAIDQDDLEKSTTVDRFVPLTAKERAKIIEQWDEIILTKDCYFPNDRRQNFLCVMDQRKLKNDGGEESDPYLSLLAYIAVNGAIMLAALMVTFFALTATMAAMRKWWRWWW